MGIVRNGSIGKMKECGRIVRKALNEVADSVSPGMSTLEIEKIGLSIIKSEGGVPSFLGFNGYPGSICVSLNDEVVHGIPSKDRIVKNGDIVSIDIGVFKDGYHGDAADTIAVGPVMPDVMLLLKTVYEARDRGIEAAHIGGRMSDIGAAIQECVESRGFSVVKTLVGHGIGRQLHEPPQVPNFGKTGCGIKLTEGLALAIEPMINVGGSRVRTLRDKWTVVTADGSLSAHAEHTVVVIRGAPLVLTA